jgi:hypothetical protein
VERSNGTEQDRLIKKIRLLCVADDAGANAYAEFNRCSGHSYPLEPGDTSLRA